MDKIERWLKVPRYPKYEVSNFGNVRSYSVVKKGKKLKPIINAHGRPVVALYRGKQFKIFFIHKLVLLAFLGQRKKGQVINHKNGVKTDNRLENLEYCSRESNELHAQKLGLKCQGIRHWNAKLTEDDILKIRKMKGKHSEIAKQFNIDRTIIGKIKLRKLWAHVP